MVIAGVFVGALIGLCVLIIILYGAWEGLIRAGRGLRRLLWNEHQSIKDDIKA